MGYYVQTPGAVTKKAELIAAEHNGEIVDVKEAFEAFDQGKGVICVVTNPAFEAAAFAHDHEQLEHFADTSDDMRPRKWVVLESFEQAAKLANYEKRD